MLKRIKALLEYRSRLGAARALADPAALSEMVQRLRLDDLALLQAKLASATLIREAMTHARPLDSREEVLADAIAAVSLQGLWCEFGVFRGETLGRIAALRPQQKVFGFDSFTGLPADWRHGFPAGTFSVSAGSLAALPGNAELVRGLFAESLPGFKAGHPGPAAFLHIDCDLHDSTRDVLTILEDRIVKGTVLLFDEFFSYPGWEAGEYRAFNDFLLRSGLRCRYISYNRSGEQVAAVIL